MTQSDARARPTTQASEFNPDGSPDGRTPFFAAAEAGRPQMRAAEALCLSPVLSTSDIPMETANDGVE